MAFRLKKTEQCQENYMPTQGIMKAFWLGTKKHSFSIDRIELPGLIDYNQDLLPVFGVTLGLIFEFLGLKLLIDVGLDWHAALAMGVIDILFAIFRHWSVVKLHVLKNKLLLVPAGGPLAVQITREITIKKVFMWFWSVLILLVCGLKITNFMGFAGGLNASGILVIISYIVVAIIHLTMTGYFGWWLFAEVTDFWEHMSYKKALHDWGVKNSGIFPPYPPPLVGAPGEINRPSVRGPILINGLNVPGYVVDRHILINNMLLNNGQLPETLFRRFNVPGANPAIKCTADLNAFMNAFMNKDNSPRLGNIYTLFTWGVLTDDHIKAFCNLIPIPPAKNTARQDLALEMLRCQFGMLGIPLPADGTENA